MDFPRTIDDFERQFPDDAACLEWLIRARWPDGFRCPRCGSGGKRLRYRPAIHQCLGCGYDVSVTAGTLMHHSKLSIPSLLAHLVPRDLAGGDAQERDLGAAAAGSAGAGLVQDGVAAAGEAARGDG